MSQRFHRLVRKVRVVPALHVQTQFLEPRIGDGAGETLAFPVAVELVNASARAVSLRAVHLRSACWRLALADALHVDTPHRLHLDAHAARTLFLALTPIGPHEAVSDDAPLHSAVRFDADESTMSSDKGEEEEALEDLLLTKELTVAHFDRRRGTHCRAPSP